MKQYTEEELVEIDHVLGILLEPSHLSFPRPIQETLEAYQYLREESKKRISGLQDLVKIQSASGNWNYDPYMHGMANGLICAVACLSGEEAKYLEAPESWLKDKASSLISETQNEDKS